MSHIGPRGVRPEPAASLAAAPYGQIAQAAAADSNQRWPADAVAGPMPDDNVAPLMLREQHEWHTVAVRPGWEQHR
jgi:hypothetical protein